MCGGRELKTLFRGLERDTARKPDSEPRRFLLLPMADLQEELQQGRCWPAWHRTPDQNNEQEWSPLWKIIIGRCQVWQLFPKVAANSCQSSQILKAIAANEWLGIWGTWIASQLHSFIPTFTLFHTYNLFHTWVYSSTVRWGQHSGLTICVVPSNGSSHSL
jgi:hypothetical protein